MASRSQRSNQSSTNGFWQPDSPHPAVQSPSVPASREAKDPRARHPVAFDVVATHGGPQAAARVHEAQVARRGHARARRAGRRVVRGRGDGPDRGPERGGRRLHGGRGPLRGGRRGRGRAALRRLAAPRARGHGRRGPPGQAVAAPRRRRRGADVADDGGPHARGRRRRARRGRERRRVPRHVDVDALAAEAERVPPGHPRGAEGAAAGGQGREAAARRRARGRGAGAGARRRGGAGAGRAALDRRGTRAVRALRGPVVRLLPRGPGEGRHLRRRPRRRLPRGARRRRPAPGAALVPRRQPMPRRLPGPLARLQGPRAEPRPRDVHGALRGQRLRRG